MNGRLAERVARQVGRTSGGDGGYHGQGSLQGEVEGDGFMGIVGCMVEAAVRLMKEEKIIIGIDLD